MQIKFWGADNLNGYLSNFYYAEMDINGTLYQTNEHFFQSQKFVGTEYEDKIIHLETPAETAKLGKSRSLPLRKDWETVKEEIMYRGLWAKFAQNPELKWRLKKTGNAELIENSPYDYYWGIGKNGTGKNRLGVLLMKLREEFRREEAIGYEPNLKELN